MAPVRKAIHEDSKVSEYLLSTTAESAFIKIDASQIAELGSGLFAAKEIDAARQIFKSKPLIACVDHRFDSICHYCLKGSEKVPLAEEPRNDPLPKACGGCRRARFCSKTCQSKAWKSFHKEECKILQEYPNMLTSHLALYRILFWTKNKRLTDDHAKVLSLLEDHFDEYSDTEAGDTLFEYTSAIRNTANPEVALSVVLRLLPAIQVNAVKLRQAEKSGYFGIALDLISCVINHSCTPNAFLFVEDGHIICRSLRQIPADEEITISYVDPMLALKSRRDFMRLEYFFDCYCSRCVMEGREQRAMVGRKIDSLRSLHEVQGKMIKLMNNTVTAVSKPGRYKEYENIEKMEVQMLSAAGSAMKDGKWPEHLDPMPMVRNTLAWLYLNKREFFAATRHALSGTLMSRYRSGPEWVNNLCTLTQCLAAIAACSRDEPFFNTGDFISLKETQRAVGGYGMVLCGDAGLVFGGKSKYTEFLCDWFAWVVKGAEVPKPGSREFEPLFWEAQKKLLAWADIDTSFAIVLPGSSDALSMEEACTRAMEEMEVAGSPVKAKDAGGVTGK